MNKCIYDIQEFCFGVVFVPRGGDAFFFGKRLSHDWDSKTNFPMGEGACLVFKKRSGCGICLSHGQLSREQEGCLRITAGGFHRLPDTSAIPAKISKAKALKCAITELAV